MCSLREDSVWVWLLGNCLAREWLPLLSPQGVCDGGVEEERFITHLKSPLL